MVTVHTVSDGSLVSFCGDEANGQVAISPPIRVPSRASINAVAIMQTPLSLLETQTACHSPDDCLAAPDSVRTSGVATPLHRATYGALASVGTPLS